MLLHKTILGASLLVCSIMAMASPEAVKDIEPHPSYQQLLENPEQIQDLLAKGVIAPEDIPQPHWERDACVACHLMGTGEKKPPLRNADVIRLCGNCHDVTVVESFIHAVAMEPPEDFIKRMSSDFKASLKRADGMVTCITCHDLPMQCLKERSEEKSLNPLFFRGGPYETRTDLCYNCHDPKSYERYNPHDQITDEGILDEEVCYFCHNAKPNRREVRSINDVDFTIEEDLKQLCTGCHPWRVHPGGTWASFGKKGPNHLRVPPDDILERLQQLAKEDELVMPLDPSTGKIFCATCHNPHERGVQFLLAADKGADGVKRLRRGKREICIVCHNK